MTSPSPRTQRDVDLFKGSPLSLDDLKTMVENASKHQTRSVYSGLNMNNAYAIGGSMIRGKMEASTSGSAQRPSSGGLTGIAKACAMAAGAPEPELVHFDANDFDFGGKKAFPMRDQHFFTSIEKAMADLDWKPEYDLVGGLTDSYEKDFGRGTFRKPVDFSVDDMILEKLKVMA